MLKKLVYISIERKEDKQATGVVSENQQAKEVISMKKFWALLLVILIAFVFTAGAVIDLDNPNHPNVVQAGSVSPVECSVIDCLCPAHQMQTALVGTDLEEKIIIFNNDKNLLSGRLTEKYRGS